MNAWYATPSTSRNRAGAAAPAAIHTLHQGAAPAILARPPGTPTNSAVDKVGVLELALGEKREMAAGWDLTRPRGSSGLGTVPVARASIMEEKKKKKTIKNHSVRYGTLKNHKSDF